MNRRFGQITLVMSLGLLALSVVAVVALAWEPLHSPDRPPTVESAEGAAYT